MTSQTGTHARETKQQVVIHFSGDSGDGMQLTGNLFTNTTALQGNDLSTFPDYPSEIRAPAGTLPGVSGFRINFSSTEIHTPGDRPDVLVAMNPAALKVNLPEVKRGGIVVINTDAFTDNALEKAYYQSNPLDDGTLEGYRAIKIPLTELVRNSLAELDLTTKTKDRCKNFYALGLMFYLYNRSMEPTLGWISEKFKNRPELVKANQLALKAGYAYGEAAQLFQETYDVPPAKLAPGRYRNLNGNTAVAMGLVTASKLAGRQLFLGSYPITPASEILHELAGYKQFGVVTFQAEDEIAGIGAALGAAYSGSLACTTTSGPGLALKTEFMGLAVITELPLVIVNVQRGGPSTGLPTKTEQADLLQAMFGRNGEAPIPIVAAATPEDCYWIAIEAARLALRHMTPVILLSDGYLANGAAPFKIPDRDQLPKFEIPPPITVPPEDFQPYSRDPKTLARPWAVPGTPGYEHRVGGLEKGENGNVSHDPQNHQKMVELRQRKVDQLAEDIPLAKAEHNPEGDLLVISWGSTYGAITAAVEAEVANGAKVGHLHLRYLNPMPKNVGDILKRFKRFLIPEMNLGQLALLMRARYLLDAETLNKVQGKPFMIEEVRDKIQAMLSNEQEG